MKERKKENRQPKGGVTQPGFFLFSFLLPLLFAAICSTRRCSTSTWAHGAPPLRRRRPPRRQAERSCAACAARMHWAR